MADIDGTQGTGEGAPGTDLQDDQAAGATPGEGSGEGGQTSDDTGVDDEVVVTIEGEAPPQNEEDEQDGPGLVNKLRRINREKERELRDLRAKQAAPAPAPQAETAGAKPTLAGCDYDEDAYDQQLLEWREKQARAAAEQQKKADAEKQESEAWQATLAGHNKAKAELKALDYDDAEAVVAAELSVTQRAIIVSGAKNSAKVEYALGKNPAKLKELASITNPVKFAFAVAELESKLTVTTRKAPPPAERRIGGNAAAAGGMDTKLASLEAEADRTGDRSKVIAYNREQRRKRA